jgi:crossover junction endodeoxyribonuclease RuvC
MKILGIDPGSTSMGYAIIEADNNTLKAIHYGTTDIKAKDLIGKLAEIRRQTSELLRSHKPVIAGIEKLFFSVNKKTALEVAQARGVIIITLLEHEIPIVEFTPGQVKIAVANYGSADKLAVRKMVMRLLKLDALSEDDNAADALAVAIATSGQAKFR